MGLEVSGPVQGGSFFYDQSNGQAVSYQPLALSSVSVGIEGRVWSNKEFVIRY